MKLINKVCLAVIAIFTLTACEKEEMKEISVDFKEVDCKTFLFEAHNISEILWKINGVKQNTTAAEFQFIAEEVGAYEILAIQETATGVEEVLMTKMIEVEELCFEELGDSTTNHDDSDYTDGDCMIGMEEWDCRTFIYHNKKDEFTHWMVEGPQSFQGDGEEFKFVAEEPGVYIMKAMFETPDYPNGTYFYDTIEVKETCFDGHYDNFCDEFEIEVIETSCHSFKIYSNMEEGVFLSVNGEPIQMIDGIDGYEYVAEYPGDIVIKAFYESVNCPSGKEIEKIFYVDPTCFDDDLKDDNHDGNHDDKYDDGDDVSYNDCNDFKVEIEELTCNTFVFHANKQEGVYWTAVGSEFQFSEPYQVFDFQAPAPGIYEVKSFYENEHCPQGKEFHHTIEVKETCFE